MGTEFQAAFEELLWFIWQDRSNRGLDAKWLKKLENASVRFLSRARKRSKFPSSSKWRCFSAIRRMRWMRCDGARRAMATPMPPTKSKRASGLVGMSRGLIKSGSTSCSRSPGRVTGAPSATAAGRRSRSWSTRCKRGWCRGCYAATMRGRSRKISASVLGSAAIRRQGWCIRKRPISTPLPQRNRSLSFRRRGSKSC